MSEIDFSKTGKDRQSQTTRNKIVVTIETLLAAYSEAVTNGNTIDELATTLGLKMESLQQRLTALRGSLRAGGATESEVKEALPSLKRRTGPRASTRSTAVADMIAAARAKVAEKSAKAANPHPSLLEKVTEALAEIPA